MKFENKIWRRRKKENCVCGIWLLLWPHTNHYIFSKQKLRGIEWKIACVCVCERERERERKEWKVGGVGHDLEVNLDSCVMWGECSLMCFWSKKAKVRSHKLRRHFVKENLTYPLICIFVTQTLKICKGFFWHIVT